MVVMTHSGLHDMYMVRFSQLLLINAQIVPGGCNIIYFLLLNSYLVLLGMAVHLVNLSLIIFLQGQFWVIAASVALPCLPFQLSFNSILRLH